MRRFILLATVLAAVASLHVSCGVGDGGFFSSDSPSNLGMAEFASRSARPESPESSVGELSMKMASSDSPEGGADDATVSDGTPLPLERMIARTATVEIEVDAIPAARKALDVALAKVGGWIKSESTGRSDSYLVVAVPSASFDAFLESVPGVGTLVRKSIEAVDYTDSYVDLEERLKTRKILLETYRGYLRRAADVTDLLKIERYVNDLTYEIERVEGSMRGIKRMVDYSDITVVLSVTPLARDDEYRELTAWERVVEAAKGLWKGLGELGIGFVIFLIYAVPLALGAWLAWFLLFGKRIGVLRKPCARLWAAINGKKPEPPSGAA